MSQWTHVCGCIRYDHIMALLPEPDFPQILGHQFGYDDYDTTWSDIPYGSEGSIRYEVLKTKEGSSISVYTVPIWGDLRDFGEEGVENIRKWFDRVTAEPLNVRSAVLLVEVEFGKSYVFQSGDFSR